MLFVHNCICNCLKRKQYANMLQCVSEVGGGVQEACLVGGGAKTEKIQRSNPYYLLSDDNFLLFRQVEQVQIVDAALKAA